VKKTVFSVDGMSCRHCIDAITKKVQEMQGVRIVTVKLEEKSVQVDYEENETSTPAIRKAVEELGYKVVESS